MNIQNCVEQIPGLLRHGIAAITLSTMSILPCVAGTLYESNYPLTDERGQTVHLSDFRGQKAVVAMEYSACRFMCSITFARLKELQAVAEMHRIDAAIIVISLDPANDTPAQWRAYRKMRGISGNRWHLLTPRLEDMPNIARALGVHYWYDGEHLLHDFRVLRLGASGEILAAMTNFDADPLNFLK